MHGGHDNVVQGVCRNGGHFRSSEKKGETRLERLRKMSTKGSLRGQIKGTKGISRPGEGGGNGRSNRIAPDLVKEIQRCLASEEGQSQKEAKGRRPGEEKEGTSLPHQGGGGGPQIVHLLGNSEKSRGERPG